VPDFHKAFASIQKRYIKKFNLKELTLEATNDKMTCQDFIDCLHNCTRYQTLHTLVLINICYEENFERAMFQALKFNQSLRVLDLKFQVVFDDLKIYDFVFSVI
jgi:hypothetical protein